MNSRFSESQLETDEVNYENSISVQICEILLFLQDLRQDWLISNIVAWFEKEGEY
jgi:hypothetical protein